MCVKKLDRHISCVLFFCLFLGGGGGGEGEEGGASLLSLSSEGIQVLMEVLL